MTIGTRCRSGSTQMKELCDPVAERLTLKAADMSSWFVFIEVPVAVSATAPCDQHRWPVTQQILCDSCRLRIALFGRRTCLRPKYSLLLPRTVRELITYQDVANAEPSCCSVWSNGSCSSDCTAPCSRAILVRFPAQASRNALTVALTSCNDVLPHEAGHAGRRNC